MSKTTFRLHVHRVALHSAEPRKWYAHIGSWGDQPRAFREIVCTVPTRTQTPVLDTGMPDTNKSCGCANAWIEGEVDPAQIAYDADCLYLGPRAKKK